MTGKKHEGDLADYDPRYMRCRGLRNHTWQFRSDYNVVTNARNRIIEFTRTLHCVGCTTDRKDTYAVAANGKFTFKSRSYEYADGYQVTRENKIETETARDTLMMMEMAQSLDDALLNRLLQMRPEAQAAVKANGPLQTPARLRAV